MGAPLTGMTSAGSGRDGDIRWSIKIQKVSVGENRCEEILFEESAGDPLKTASVGKVLLLIHLAREIAGGRLDPQEPLTRIAQDWVADSGIWQYLAVDTLSIADLCELVGGASDNLATNVVLRRVGLEQVRRTASDLGLTQTALHDFVRDQRGPADPATLSTGSAAELVQLMAGLSGGQIFDAATSTLALGWLGKGLDLSQVAAGWRLDPLAHFGFDRGFRLHHKTGTDLGVRADIGLLEGPAATVAYAVIANWHPDQDLEMLDRVLDRQREIGLAIYQAAGR